MDGFDTKEPLPYQLELVLTPNSKGEIHNCGATLISSKHAVSAYHCFAPSYRDWEKEKVEHGYPSSTKPLDIFIVVAGAYYSRNYILNSTTASKYEFQVSIYTQLFCFRRAKNK